MDGIHEEVQEYYGDIKKRVAEHGNVCKIAGCEELPPIVQKAIASVNPTVAETYYGCGLTIPSHVEGLRVLDLGSGTGRDCFAISKLVGEKGSVVGVDMTDNQLSIAREFVDYHTKMFGYGKSNVEFVKGYIEKLGEAGLTDSNFDLIVSNCVVNLSPDKKAVLREAYRVLQPGGELFFSDVYTNKVIPEHLQKDKVLWGECLAGAMTWQELVDFALEVGFSRPRMVVCGPMEVVNEKAVESLKEAGIRFASATYRLFKLAKAPASRSKVTYLGTATDYPDELPFDAVTTFKTGCAVDVSADLAEIIRQSRYSSVFSVEDSANKVCQELCPVDPFEYLPGEELPKPCCCGPQKTTP